MKENKNLVEQLERIVKYNNKNLTKDQLNTLSDLCDKLKNEQQEHYINIMEDNLYFNTDFDDENISQFSSYDNKIVFGFDKKVGNFSLISDKIKKTCNSKIDFPIDTIINLGRVANKIKNGALRKLTIKLDDKNTVILLGYRKQKSIMLDTEYHIKDLYKCYHKLEDIREVLSDLDFYDGMTGYLNGNLETFNGLEVEDINEIEELSILGGNENE